MPVCVINQPSGLGDILFCQKIGKHYVESGYEVLWAVDNQYFDCVCEHLGGSGIKYINKESHDYPFKTLVDQNYMLPVFWGREGSVYLPLMYSDRTFTPRSWMMSKYETTGIESYDWKDHIDIYRNTERENRLVEHLNLPDRFVLINNTYGPPGEHKSRELSIESNLPSINVQWVSGYTPFDWMGIIERSEEFHTVDTSFCYMVETMECDTKFTMHERHLGISDVIENVFDWDLWNWRKHE